MYAGIGIYIYIKVESSLSRISATTNQIARARAYSTCQRRTNDFADDEQTKCSLVFSLALSSASDVLFSTLATSRRFVLRYIIYFFRALTRAQIYLPLNI